MTITKERERLTRERIIAAALRVMDTDGLEAVSMRRIAREVGVEAMSLYHHVRDKEDVLDGICEAVMREFEYPDGAGDISERLRAGARSYRRILQAHPDVVAHTLADNSVLLTASSEDSRRFLTEFLQRPGAIEDGEIWRRRKP